MVFAALLIVASVGTLSASVDEERREHLLRTDWRTLSGQHVPNVDRSQRWHPTVEVAHEAAQPNNVIKEVAQPMQNLTLTQTTKQFLASLSPCKHCKSYRRFGGAHDGGYVMCTDDMGSANLVAVYSYGISGEDGWGMDVAKTYNIPLFEYDCENQNAPIPYPGVQAVFNKKCVVAKTTDGSHTTLGEQLSENNHDGQVKEGSLLMKMDIEGAEWDLLASLPRATVRKFQQIVVEFHHLGQQTQHGRYLRAIKNILNAGFVVAHLHGNNIIHPTQQLAGTLSTNAGMVHFGRDQIPDVLEVTFVKQALSGQPCQSQGDFYHVQQDSRNSVDFPEIVDPILPVPLNREVQEMRVAHTGVISPEKARKAFGKLKVPPLDLGKLKMLVDGLDHDADDLTKTH